MIAHAFKGENTPKTQDPGYLLWAIMAAPQKGLSKLLQVPSVFRYLRASHFLQNSHTITPETKEKETDRYEGNTEEENNGHVVFKKYSRGSAGKKGGCELRCLLKT